MPGSYFFQRQKEHKCGPKEKLDEPQCFLQHVENQNTLTSQDINWLFPPVCIACAPVNV
jgi:hypothetical protein